jgi:hypothetical protein
VSSAADLAQMIKEGGTKPRLLRVRDAKGTRFVTLRATA